MASRRSNTSALGALAQTDQPTRRRAVQVACVAVLAVEAVGSLLMWAAVPLAWLWVGGRVYTATGSLAADLGTAFLGLLATAVVLMRALVRLDRGWVALRRAAGQDQVDGVLTRIVIVSAALAILAFLIWYYVLTTAFVMPFTYRN